MTACNFLDSPQVLDDTTFPMNTVPKVRRYVLLVAATCMISCASVYTDNSASTEPSRSGMIDIGGTAMYYEVSGTGQPLLLLHAGIADCSMWDEQVAGLSRQLTVIRCDLRGFGRTPRGSVHFSHHRDVATLLDSLGIGKIHIAGASFGGRVAIDFALAYPERTLSLVLCAPAISGAPPTPELVAIDSVEESFMSKGDTRGAADFTVRTWVVGPDRRPDEVSSALRQRILEMQLHNYSMETPAGAKSVPLEPRAMTRLEEIQVPTLIMTGDKDVLSFQDLSAIAARRIPHARKTVVAGVAHMISMEKPEIFNRLLLEFIVEHSH
jgi:3-oxoadipate enol-lactonase